MDKYKRYHGILILILSVVVLLFLSYKLIGPKVDNYGSVQKSITEKSSLLEQKKSELNIVKNKIKKIRDSIVSSQKKIFSPVESDLGNDSLFFTLYNDLIEMLQNNSVKVKSIQYSYNPTGDAFVEFGKDVYFVCDIDLELVSSYVNLGKLIQDIYQYPYYIRINQLDVEPYQKDRKILISNLSLRLYAHTESDKSSGLNNAQ